LDARVRVMPLLARFLDELLDVFVKEVLGRLDATDIALLARTNKACRYGVVTSGLPRAGSSEGDELRLIHFARTVPLLTWARAEGCPWGRSTCMYAAHGGHLDVLKWARAEGCPWGEDTCTRAALGGHLDVLKWARAEGCPLGEDICRVAAFGGHLDVLKWTRAEGCQWDELTCMNAALVGHLDMLMWARDEGCPWDERTCSGAALLGHLDVLKWAKAEGCPCNESVCLVVASRMGHTHVVVWLERGGATAPLLLLEGT